MILLDEITEHMCHQNASKYPISQFKYLNMVKKKLDEIEVHIAENLDLFNEKKGAIEMQAVRYRHENKISKRQKIDMTAATGDIVNKEFERLCNEFTKLSNKNELGKESKTLELLQTYHDKIKKLSTDIQFKFIGDFDQNVVHNFQLNLDAIYILVTICKIWGNELPQTETMTSAAAAIDENISKIIASMERYLTFLR